MINLLFTSVGRRVELVQQFIEARQRKGIQGNVICADMNELSPALYFGDRRYKVPAVNDPTYISILQEICLDEEIDLIIPTIDTELGVLSENINKFQSIDSNILVSPPDVISISQNKWNTYTFFKSIGIKTPNSFIHGMDYDIWFPCFIKPIAGSSSVNAYKVHNERELEFYKKHIRDYILQEYINGSEYTVDVLCDFDGNPIFITPRIRLATRSGEVMKTRIHNDEDLIDKTMRIIDALHPKGPITIQAIKDNDNEYSFIEINARFGGGAPLSMMAGANSAEAIYDLLNGKKLSFVPFAAEEGAIFLRFDQSIRLVTDSDGYEKA